MSAPAPIEYNGIRAVSGPLMMVEGVEAAAWDEDVEIELPSGERRHGVVLEVDRDLAVVQIFEGSQGIGRLGTRVRFSGTPLQVPLSESWLGRVCSGRGEPLDGGPAVTGKLKRQIAGRPINPAFREPPSDPVITGVSAIDLLTTLVLGQKLPVFSVGGLPHFELAAQIAAQARSAGTTFRIIFAAMGLTHADAALVQDVLETRAGQGELAMFLNTAADPVVERILTPRLALTVGEHLAFDLGYDVLVVMADMTSYCEAVREVASARNEIPARRGFPGYLYSDLASLYERSGRIQGRPGSLTQVPVLSMPSGDITHPVPDLTGYITEGQLVLAPEVNARGIYPPFDPLSSLSRVMRHGVGEGRTRADHMGVASQVFAALARARQARELLELVGEAGLSASDRRHLEFEAVFQHELVSQRRDESRTMEQTLERAWKSLDHLPRRELSRIDSVFLDAYHHPVVEADR